MIYQLSMIEEYRDLTADSIGFGQYINCFTFSYTNQKTWYIFIFATYIIYFVVLGVLLIINSLIIPNSNI